MPNAFPRTTRALQTAGARAWTGAILFALLLLLAWTGWLLLGRVPLYEVTDTGRLEVNPAVHPLSSTVEGRIVETSLVLGREVRAGEVVAELESGAERLAIEEGAARLLTFGSRLAALRSALAAEEDALRVHRSSSEAAANEALARAREADLRARQAEAEAARTARLHATGAATALELERAEAEALAQRAASDALALSMPRLRGDRRVEEGDRRARSAELHRELAQLRGDSAAEAAAVHRLMHVVDQRRIRAPIMGRIGETAELEVGAVVRAGERLGSVIPPGELRVVAFFPADALGRIRPEQSARIRLAGFPWTEYGRLRGRVVRVAREPRGGRFRVELALEGAASSAIPLEHGLPGSVEVEVERVAPLALLLRSAGRARSPEGHTASSTRPGT